MAVIKVPEVHKEPSGKSGILLEALAWVLEKMLPLKASPDYDGRMRMVSYWLVEIDEDGYPMREVGFTAQHEPILFAPTTRNYGLWTDSDRVFSRDEFEERANFPFDAIWNKLLKNSKQVPL
ncbi:hypothetical protein [Hymenobacter convexus]|uniref:hypothetical protein n=1 Tax=Hymenobacter sp. CA1UV-4 TaxID=3063782 RepID=UPI0027135828|nr:hypothetical protein [Hymenobacter sp. CA1UV-4]MDO7854012.1 hypothetical protein [Hymenobacter sp. CA1UV-4]